MGMDCVFVAENRNKITPQDIEKDSVTNKFPDGSGKLIEHRKSALDFETDYFEPQESQWAYCKIEFVNDLVIVHSGCRWLGSRDFQLKMMSYLSEKCGGRVGLWNDCGWDTMLDTADAVTETCKTDGGIVATRGV